MDLNGAVWGQSRGLGAQWEWGKGQRGPFHVSPCVPKSFLCPLFYSGHIASLEGCPGALTSTSGKDGNMSQGSPTCLRVVVSHLCSPTHPGESQAVLHVSWT